MRELERELGSEEKTERGEGNKESGTEGGSSIVLG